MVPEQDSAILIMGKGIERLIQAGLEIGSSGST